MDNLINIVSHFIASDRIERVEPLGEGLINDTY